MRICPIGLVGWGTVGDGVVSILRQDAAVLRERVGLDLRLKRIVTRTPGRARSGDALGAVVSDRIEDLTADAEITTVIHLANGPAAKPLMVALLTAGKRVVTGNKALIAEHGDELFALAQKHGGSLAFEAAVAGGIPVIAALRDGLVANRINAIHAILNGTCNFILTMMETKGWDYAVALVEAQRLGYAELDPTLDVDGTDTAHKLAILTRIAFACRVPLTSIRTEGIQHLNADDIASARTMGCRIKLIATAAQTPAGLDLHVAPTLVPLDHPLAAVMRNFNGIYINGSNSGPQLFTGQGAGAAPTASAILADVVDTLIGRAEQTAAQFAFVHPAEPPALAGEADEVTGSWARFHVHDRPGVLAGITERLSRHGISVLSIHQGLPTSAGAATVEISTHPGRGGAFLLAVAEIDRAGFTTRPTTCLRRL